MPVSRLQFAITRTPASFVEDVAVLTSHYTNATGGLLSTFEMQSVEAAWGTYWNYLQSTMPTLAVPKEFRWYDQQVWPTKSPLLRVQAAALGPGTGTGNVVPPQCAVSCTLETATRRRWGRWYLPSPTTGAYVSTTGRLTNATATGYATALRTLVNTCNSAGCIVVVWSPRGGSGPPAFSAGSYLPVNGVRVDDLLDVIRSRRWQAAPFRQHYPIP